MTNQEILSFPAIAMRGIVVFPNNVVAFDVGRKKSKNAVIESLERGQKIYLVTQKDFDTEEPDEKMLYKVGVVCELSQTVKVGDGNIKVIAKGLYRAKTLEIIDKKNHLEAVVTPYPEKVIRLKDKTESGAVIGTVQTLFSEYNELAGPLPKEVMAKVMTSQDMRFLSEFIPSQPIFRFEDKQTILEESSCLKRLRIICALLDREINVLDLENEILGKVRTNLDKNQRDYMLREQMQVIARELGEDDNPLDESALFMEKIKALPLSEKAEKKLTEECKKFAKMPYSSHEASVLRSYLEYVLALPFGVKSNQTRDIKKASKQLDNDHYGLKEVKERILETISVSLLSGGKNKNIICLYGPPGVGKTSIAKSIAEALGRKYVRVALGGVHDEAEIRGHRKTYIGAMPGKIISAIKSAETLNPLILLDEIDKISSDRKGDPASALLEVLDSEQNFSFTDNYIEIPFDLSDVLFITTANDISSIPRPLYDRMEIIEIPGYTRDEKLMIAKRHLIKKELSENGFEKNAVKFTDSALLKIIDSYTREAGVRTLSRLIASILRKCARKLLEEGETYKTITPANVKELLGEEKYFPDEIYPENEFGIASGLAWTEVGGEVLPVEVLVLEGSGKTVFTGSLGDVFKESCSAGVSFIRSISNKLPIDKEFYKNTDIHLHAPEGAVPKDGPSAGVAIVSALISALTEIPVRSDTAMTGEITLKGRVLPIGGLREKVMAAHRAGIKRIVIPKANIKDLEKIDEKVKKDLTFIPCENISEVLSATLKNSPYLPSIKEEDKRFIPNENKKGVSLAQ